jgi:hypothetical protein
MGEASVKWARANKPKPKKRSAQEEKALNNLRAEAKAHGATLASDGEGGLDPSLVLGVMRRDGYECKNCGENKNLSVHHKGGVPKSKWLSKKGHSNDPNNISTICESCHDREHNKAREEGVDSSQVLPEGDKGTRRDHGQPDAKPTH